MISTRLKAIFAGSVLLFVVHGLEEYLSGFYETDGLYEAIFHPLFSGNLDKDAFLVFQLMLWALLSVAALMLISERARFYILAAAGLIYMFELHHLVKAVLAGGYYPGLITALLFPIVAFFFWKEWFRIWRARRSLSARDELLT